ncbi:MAG: asparagine synthase (glutamine-hydrolyzing) [Planctomycetota bacterium]
MCGIFGFALDEAREHRTLPDLAAMGRSLQHRGPEGTGSHMVGFAGVGATRLRLVDARREADPPARSEDGCVVAVLNGEVYNHRELRVLLEERGHRMRALSDASLLPHLWEEFGVDLLPRLRGAFALAVLDCRAGSLLLARDRLGEKPLYLHEEAGRLLFASEPRTFALAGGSPLEPAREDLPAYLRLGYVPSPRSGLQHVRRLEPARYLLWKRHRGIQEEKCYWVAPPQPGVESGLEGAAERVEALLGAAVREQLECDREIGVILSGGIDSGLVAAFARRARGAPIKAYTLAVSGPFNESREATSTARHLGLTHRVIPLEAPTPEELVQLIERLGEPLADSSAIAMDALARAAREEVVAVLAGEGGDELFGGYRRFAAQRIAALLGPLLPRHRRPPRGQPLERGRAAACRRFLRGARLGAPDLPGYWRSYFWDGDAPELLGRSDLGPWPRRPCGDGAASLEGVRREELLGPLPDDLLVKVDRLSMAQALEVRCPFLDHRLVEFALSLPAHHLVSAVETKKLLRRLALRHLPRDVARARKRGFGVPVGEWLRGPLAGIVRELGAGRAGSAFDGYGVGKLVAEHRCGKHDHGARLYALAVWSLWTSRVRHWNEVARRADH